MLTTKEYLKIAYEYAMKHSTDPSTQNGAIIVSPEGEILTYGANHFPNGVLEKPERWVRPKKYEWVEHAERECIFSAARQGIKIEGCTMYAAWASCHDCARAIIESGIKEVITHLTPHQKAHANWKNSIATALTMFEESGIKISWFEDPIGDGIKIRFNGKVVNV